MYLWDLLAVAIRALSVNKLRAGLTMLGIIIGISAVITLVSVGEGVRQIVTDELQGIGSNLLFILPGDVGTASQGGRSQFLRSANTSGLTYGDAMALNDPLNAPDVLMAAPEFVATGRVIYGNKDVNTSINGVTPEYQQVRNFYVLFGEFIEPDDLTSQARVAVLGQTVLEKLFPDGAYPIGQTIKINRVPFRVIGVMEEKGGSGFSDEDDVVYIPITTAQTRLFLGRDVSGEYSASIIYAQVVSEDRIEQAKEQVRAILRQRHNLIFGDQEDDFTILTQADVLAVMGSLSTVLTLFLGLIATISLLVGGIGIMNIMLVSVTERTREIGIRKAVGAKRRDILMQFLLEAVVLSFVGGAIGIMFGVLGAVVISRYVADLNTYISPNVIALATTFSIAVGLFFGIYPAMRAAQLNPIDALRYE